MALSQLSFRGDLDASVGNLSFGNRRKMVLAEALAEDIRLVLIDEATAGLDQNGVRGLNGLIENRRDAGACIVVAEQDTIPAPWADTVLAIENESLKIDHRTPDTIEEVRLRGPKASITAITEFAAGMGVHEISEFDS